MTHHPLTDDYLERLDRAAAHLPPTRRAELRGDIEAHLAEALGPEPSDADVRTVLDRLGAPEEIVAAEQPRPPAPVDGRGTREWAAIILLLLGGFVAFLGWIAGLILLWSSRAWTTRDKLIGTLLWPGGLATGGFVALIAAAANPETCSTTISASGPAETTCSGGMPVWLAIGVTVIALLVPFVTAVYLARRAGRTT
jgi:hypothetical protein